MNISPTTHARVHVWRAVLRSMAQQSASVAVLFWGGWLVLAGLESSIGSNLVSSWLFLLSLPLLVALLTWTSRSIIVVVQQRYLAVLLMGVMVLTLASLVTAIGIMSTASLKSLLGGI